jgi:cellulose synthase (UDP-forming)
MAARAAAIPNTIPAQRVMGRQDYLLYACLTALQGLALALFCWWWLQLKFDAVTLVVTLLVLHAAAIRIFGWMLLPSMRRPLPVPARPGYRVGVATTFVAGSEPLEMLEETLEALVELRLPHDTWVLDEADDDRVRALCTRLGASHFTRKHLPRYQQESGSFRARTKHGNYNAWLEEVGYERYDIILGFDPDHVPEPDYLEGVLGYFEDAGIGYVQAAQVYYNQSASFIARGAAEESYEFYSIGQMASYAGGYPMVIGSHQCHRVAALREVGGFPAHDAEDLLLTLRYRATGWRGVYVPKVLARGLTPVDWSAYLAQQTRWARAILDIKLRQFPRLARSLPAKERLLGFLHGFQFLQVLWVPVAILLLVYLLVSGATPDFVSYEGGVLLGGLYLALLVGRFYSQRFYLDPSRERGVHWRAALLRLAKWPTFLVAVGSVVRGRPVPYALTPKVRGSALSLAIVGPHLAIAVIVSSAWGIGVASGHAIHPLLHLFAGLTTVASLGLAATGFWSFPPPYEPGEARSASSEEAEKTKLSYNPPAAGRA